MYFFLSNLRQKGQILGCGRIFLSDFMFKCSNVKFTWNEECQQSLDLLKEKMVIASFLVFPNWEKEFHVHVDASYIALGAILAQEGEWDIDHPLAFSSQMFSTIDNNYTILKEKDLKWCMHFKSISIMMPGPSPKPVSSEDTLSVPGYLHTLQS